MSSPECFCFCPGGPEELLESFWGSVLYQTVGRWWRWEEAGRDREGALDCIAFHADSRLPVCPRCLQAACSLCFLTPCFSVLQALFCVCVSPAALSLLREACQNALSADDERNFSCAGGTPLMQPWPARRVTKWREPPKAKCRGNARTAVVPGSAVSRHFPASRAGGEAERISRGWVYSDGRCHTS